MSALAGVIRWDSAPVSAPLLERLLDSQARRGGDRRGTWVCGGVGLGVSRNEWELRLGGPSKPAAEHDLVVVADASLYYEADLRAALRAVGVQPTSSTPAHLILSAYRAWGPECTDRLEGDFAFAVWDSRTETLFCARDPAGARPLHYVRLGDTVAVATCAAALLEVPGCPRDLDLEYVAELAVGLFGAADASCHAAVSQLPAGHWIAFQRSVTERRRYWTPPRATPFRRASLEDDAQELRHLLSRAVLERMDSQAPTTVWMSGGMDSTALFAAGTFASGESGPERALPPVSISYPQGDPGREDEYIAAILEHWNVPGHWVDIRDVPVVEGFATRAPTREDAFVHPYEAVTRALVARSRAAGSRIALNGSGADGLFSASPAYMSDLLYRGRWLACAREWRGWSRWRARPFYRWVIRPGLPRLVRAVVARARGGRRMAYHFERPRVPWLRPDAADRLMSSDRQLSYWTEPAGPGALGRELHLCLTYPVYARVTREIAALGFDGGIEIRCPYHDKRVIEFAARRPWWHKVRGRETKVILRRAMQGLLPAEVLRPRPRKTGFCTHHFASHACTALPAIFRRVFTDSRLADLGIIDVDALVRTAELYREGGAGTWAMELIWTLHAELWIRAQEGPAAWPLLHEVDSMAMAAASTRERVGASPDAVVGRESFTVIGPGPVAREAVAPAGSSLRSRDRSSVIGAVETRPEAAAIDRRFAGVPGTRSRTVR